MIFTALLLGIGGSLHCAGMCSPLAMSLTSFNRSVWTNRVLYNLGRIVMYGLLGYIVGTIGSMLPLHSFQTILSITLGTILIALGLGIVRNTKIPIIGSAIARFSLWIKQRFYFLIKQHGYGSLFIMGMLNGLLPCGLTYLALGMCLTAVSGSDAFIFMSVMGIGTLPAMLGLPWAIQQVAFKMNVGFRKIITIMMVVTGVILVVHGAFTTTHRHTLVVSSIQEEKLCIE